MSEHRHSGRPKSRLDLKPGWEQRILDIYRDGGSDVEVKAIIYDERGSFSNDLFERWLKEEPSFSATIHKGRALCEAWWERMGRKNLKAELFQTGLYNINMRNRFGWDKPRAESSDAPQSPTIIVTNDRTADMVKKLTDG